jgi:hypothetical protein
MAAYPPTPPRGPPAAARALAKKFPRIMEIIGNSLIMIWK